MLHFLYKFIQTCICSINMIQLFMHDQDFIVETLYIF